MPLLRHSDGDWSDQPLILDSIETIEAAAARVNLLVESACVHPAPMTLTKELR